MTEWVTSTDNRVTGTDQLIYLFDVAAIQIEGFDFSPIQESGVGLDLTAYMSAFSGNNFDPDLEWIGIESWLAEDPNDT